MRKISEDYNVITAREELLALFPDNVTAESSINAISDQDVCVLAGMLAGKSITTAGYSIPADYGVKRASAVALRLEQFAFPVSTRRVETESDVGSKTYQSLFFISEKDRERLRTDPDTVFCECKQLASQKKLRREKQDMRRLLKELGTDGVQELLNQVANDGSDSKKNTG
ncbi:hypothetical protein [Edaphovirga cremea]|uniref:hypothetical protein n=1 Tax=Edaphovirga cremea TaxID=2267246 RepID=UPI0039898906